METKKCSTCKEEKPLSNFYKNGGGKNGFRADCIPCFLAKRKRYYQDYRKLHITEIQAKHKVTHLKVKVDVLTHYSNGTCACVKCGFSDIRALSIDHIAGGGAKQLRALGFWTKYRGGGGYQFYLWLRRNGYPKGYQTLCMNCQWIKRHENGELN